MKRNTVRIISALVAVALVFTFIFAFISEIVVNTHADAANTVSSLNSKLSKLANEKTKIQKELKTIESKKQSTMTKKPLLTDRLTLPSKKLIL